MTRPGDPVDPLFLTFQSALAGRYSIDRELGRGGMGIVYLAREVHLDRAVAIKLLPPDRAAQALLRQRFLREARLAAGLSHPNIIPIHAVEDAGGFVFYVMAYVDGETLAERVRQRGPLAIVGGHADPPRGGLGPGVGPRAGSRSSGREARQHPDRAILRPCPRHRLRHRRGGRRRRRWHLRHARIHEPGTGAWGTDRCAERPLRTRRHGVLRPHGTFAVRGKQPHRSARPPGHRAGSGARVPWPCRSAEAGAPRRSLPRQAARASPGERAGVRRAAGPGTRTAARVACGAPRLRQALRSARRWRHDRRPLPAAQWIGRPPRRSSARPRDSRLSCWARPSHPLPIS